MDVIIYRTRALNPVVEAEVIRLKHDLPDFAVVVVAYQSDYGANDHNQGVFRYGAAHLAALPYPAKLAGMDYQNTTGHNDLPVLQFYRDHPQYDAYWVIEDDVRWTGATWRLLMDELQTSTADLLGTAVQTRSEAPMWHWWPTLRAPYVRPFEATKAFCPFLRASKAAMVAIDDAYQRGWGGHYESTWPSICAASGLQIADIGGNGRFTPDRWRGKHYSNDPHVWSLAPGTFVWRPKFHADDFKTFARAFAGQPMLWHPVR